MRISVSDACYNYRFFRNQPKYIRSGHSCVSPSAMRTNYTSHSVLSKARYTLASNYDLLSCRYDCDYRSIYPLYNTIGSDRYLHTSSVLLADPAKASSKVEETVNALKEKASPQEYPNEENKPTAVVVKKSIKQKIIDEIVHYYHGFRLLFIDIKISTMLVWRVLRGNPLSRREHNLVSRNWRKSALRGYFIGMRRG